MLIAAVSSETLTSMYTTPPANAGANCAAGAQSLRIDGMEDATPAPAARRELCSVEDAAVEAPAPGDEDDRAEQRGDGHRGADAEDEAQGEQARAGKARRAAVVDLDLDELENDRQGEEREKCPRSGRDGVATSRRPARR